MNLLDPSRPLRILIADDHAIVREGLRRILEGSAADWRVAEAADGFEALRQLRSEPFDVLLADLSMPGMNGLALIKRAHDEFPRLAVLVLSMHAEPQYALRALKAGARGYLTKDGAGSELAQAVRQVAAGKSHVPAALAEVLVQQLRSGSMAAPHESLSDRELDVLQRIAAGQRPAEIAAALHVSVKTISSHKLRIQDKLRLPTTAALVRYAIAHGLLEGRGAVEGLDAGELPGGPA